MSAGGITATEVLVLINMVTPEELQDDEEYDNILVGYVLAIFLRKFFNGNKMEVNKSETLYKGNSLSISVFE